MEILFRGKPPSERLYQGTCSTCSTRVQFQQSEAQACDDARSPLAYYIKCPVCYSGTIWGKS